MQRRLMHIQWSSCVGALVRPIMAASRRASAYLQTHSKVLVFFFSAPGWFTPQAEVTNARAAMLGIAVVAVLEWNAGVCFF